MNASTFVPGLLLVGLMGALTAIERRMPLQRRTAESTRHLRINLPLTVLTFLVYAVLYGALLGAAGASRSAGFGVLPWLEASAIVEGLVTLAVLDLATYGAHRSMHALPVLWRVHRVHHIDSAVDATTAFRQHPFETLYRAGALGIAAVLLGAAPEMIVLYRTLSSVNALFEHANIRVPRGLDAFLALAFVTPNMHKVHHSRLQPETDSNYGNLLSGFDRLFGSFLPTDRAFGVTYGLEGYDGGEMYTLPGVLRLPHSHPPSLDLGARA
jgi:sterol desaturase/sphingolipid hydroxylase (fatty acid hydroxylase superfamily)